MELTEALLLQPVVSPLYKIPYNQQFQDKTKLMFSLQCFGELLRNCGSCEKAGISQLPCLDCLHLCIIKSSVLQNFLEGDK